MDKKIILGAAVIFLGLYWLLTNMGVLEPIRVMYFWPGAIILFGFWIILRNQRK